MRLPLFLKSIRPSASRLFSGLFHEVDLSSLVFFRIVYGACVLWFMCYYYEPYIVNYISAPGFHFTHFGFDWIRPWPGHGVYYQIVVLRVLAFFFTIGFCYRLSAVLFFGGYAYIFLLETTVNRNHPYLICLISFLMIFMPAHRGFSVDALLRSSIRGTTVPAWNVYILRLQFFVVYFYAGVAKMSWDWLYGEPIRGRLQHYAIGHYFTTHEWALFAMCLVGLLFDLFVGFGLLFRRSRLMAWVISVLFHVINSLIWDIDMFPHLMIGCTLIFFDPNWPKQVITHVTRQRFKFTPIHPAIGAPLTLWREFACGLLIVYAAIQVIVPLRHFIYPGNVAWTTEGHRFAWRMMTIRTRTIPKFLAVDPKTGERWEINPQEFGVPYYGYNNPWSLPDAVLLFSRHAARELERQGRKGIQIHAEIYASLNGRRPQLLINPKIDLAAQPRTLWPATWINPLTEAMPRTADERLAAVTEWERLGGDSRQF
ncbi:MAG: HTTM domain-containing protein [Candidatus Hydrogenedentes bacterium]|nr:HTTM domain-containing protein [Candidatus Hydrogenedentota bacterium]